MGMYEKHDHVRFQKNHKDKGFWAILVRITWKSLKLQLNAGPSLAHKRNTI